MISVDNIVSRATIVCREMILAIPGCLNPFTAYV